MPRGADGHVRGARATTAAGRGRPRPRGADGHVRGLLTTRMTPRDTLKPGTDTQGDAALPRRGWFRHLLAVSLGAVAGLVPVGAGLAVFLDPLRRRETGGGFVKLTTLAGLPPDGVPRRFVVLADQVNAWTRRNRVRIGAVYLRRTGETELQALHVACPHAGCLVDYATARNGFLCPCHDSTFALDGSINDPRSPSPRGLDQLEVEIRGGTEVWVRFQNFRAGIREKVPA